MYRALFHPVPIFVKVRCRKSPFAADYPLVSRAFAARSDMITLSTERLARHAEFNQIRKDPADHYTGR